jgi:uncharacterized membrane-anchored protein
MSFIRNCIMAAAIALSLPVQATAEEKPAFQNEISDAIDAANKATQAGPQKIPVSGQAAIDLPKGYGFVPAAQSVRLLKAMGNRPGDDVAGLILPLDDEAQWFVVVRYIAAGYIKDDDARDWKADELLKSIREGTEESNEERRKRSLPELEVVGWVEAPHYEAATHRLVWSLSTRAKNGPADDNGVNYNTLALGREGYVSMNLVSDLKAIEALKPTAKMLLGTLNFNDGKRYADFNEKTDKVAEYGLAALVAGVAAKKLGLFAVIAAFALKFAKVIGIAVIGAGAGFAKFFGRKKDQDQA